MKRKLDVLITRKKMIKTLRVISMSKSDSRPHWIVVIILDSMNDPVINFSCAMETFLLNRGSIRLNQYLRNV
ncbi:hypothetical protein F8M41_006027 [Gigaspora margarita]|uniref:Uncharacterized protein n=1 Tax=Gigaspora margarita TaxID=4874 RepID=A0A8H4AX67_GIGMA|nr:hypothetical protein F8M41_006027 [Gigaspora margarita]